MKHSKRPFAAASQSKSSPHLTEVSGEIRSQSQAGQSERLERRYIGDKGGKAPEWFRPPPEGVWRTEIGGPYYTGDISDRSSWRVVAMPNKSKVKRNRKRPGKK